MDSKKDERFSDSVPERSRMLACFPVQVCKRSFVFGKFQSRIFLRQNHLGNKKKGFQVLVGYYCLYGKEGINLRCNYAKLANRPDGGIVEFQKFRYILLDLVARCAGKKGHDLAVTL